MAKPKIMFTAVPYNIGTYNGYRPQLEAQPGVYDLDFCKEVVEAKRLQTSPNELLHEIQMLAEVAASRMSEDGRPRGITKLIKWNRVAKGNLESPTSPWDSSTCKARIVPMLLADAVKEIDGTFINSSEGIGVKLNYVAYPGAQTVINVVKQGEPIVAYGNHLEWLAGDTAKITVGTTDYALTCTESDVAHAKFNWPAGLTAEAGTPAVFEMKSRGGIEEGEVYTSKKKITILADAPEVTTVEKVYSKDHETDLEKVYAGKNLMIEGTMLKMGASSQITFSGRKGNAVVEGCFFMAQALTNANTFLELDISGAVGSDWDFDNDSPVVLNILGVTRTVTYKTA